METWIISLTAVLISAASLLMSCRRESRTGAAEQAALGTKLDAIGDGVQDIRSELRTVRESINRLETRVTRAEERGKSNSHRLDALTGSTGVM